MKRKAVIAAKLEALKEELRRGKETCTLMGYTKGDTAEVLAPLKAKISALRWVLS